MIKITDEIRREVINYLDIDIWNDDEYNEYPDDFYSFYYRCMKADMHYALCRCRQICNSQHSV